MILLSNKESWKKAPQMRVKGLVQSIIGSKGFVLEDITVGTEMNEIKLSAPMIKCKKMPGKKCRDMAERRKKDRLLTGQKSARKASQIFTVKTLLSKICYSSGS